jgi:RHS repeat-associated protein
MISTASPRIGLETATQLLSPPRERPEKNEYLRLVSFDAAGAFVGEDTQTHDSNGNRIANGEHRLFFDLFDRLVRVERVSDGVTVGNYRYDAAGRRVHKEFLNPASGAQESVFFVSDGAREIEELDGAGNVIADYVYGSLYVDQVVQMRRGGQDYYLHSNSIFSVSAVTNAAGTVVERYSYGSVYGTVTVTDDAGGALGAAAEIRNPWRFTGRRLDAETGLYYYRLRFYDPAQGRFVSRDPLGMWGDPGQRGVEQGYCGGNPVNRVDPFGLWTLRLDKSKDKGDPATWRLMAVAEKGDSEASLYNQIDPDSLFVQMDWKAKAGDEVDITDYVNPRIKNAILTSPKKAGENCYSFALATLGANFRGLIVNPAPLLGGLDAGSLAVFENRLKKGPVKWPQPVPNPSGAEMTAYVATDDQIVGIIDRSTKKIAKKDVPRTTCAGLPSFKTLDHADILVFETATLVDGSKFPHATVVVLKDRAGRPWVVEKPNPQDPLVVRKLSDYSKASFTGTDGTSAPHVKTVTWKVE